MPKFLQAIGTLSIAFAAIASGAGINDEIVDHRAGAPPLCTNCDYTQKEFLNLLGRMQVVASEATNSPEKLPETNDFVESRSGILIHKNCFKPGRWKFDIEQAALESMVKGMSCLAEGEEQYGTNGKGIKTSTRFGLFPQFVKYLDATRWDQTMIPYSKKNGGIVFYDTCENVKRDQYFGAHMLDDCEVVRDYGNRPKLFCDSDLSHRQLVTQSTSEAKALLQQSSAYATAGSNDPVILNYNGKTKIFNGPSINFKQSKTREWSKEFFESVLFHEMIHNLGYVHKYGFQDQPMMHHDYAVFCQAYCFADVHQGLSAANVEKAKDYCLTYTVNEASDDFANEILRDAYKTAP